MENDASASANWKRLYEAAVLEPDPVKARQRLKEAQAAIGQRIEEIKQSGDTAEAGALLNALNTVVNLRRIAERERDNH